MTSPQPEAASDLIGGLRPPVVFAVRTADGTHFKFYCRWCDRFHIHGAGEGHAVAHCLADDSPLRITGYDLSEISALRPPRRRYKLLLGSDGNYYSGLVAAQRMARARR
jgi:hypothetical protein